MFASSSKHVLSTSIRSKPASALRLKCLRDLRKSLQSDVRCAHQYNRPRAASKIDHRARAAPWSNSGTSSEKVQLQPQFHQLSPLATFNTKLQNLCTRGFLPDAFGVCLEMKKEGIDPNIMTYKYLMRALAKGSMHTETLAVFRDMQAMGIEPDQESYNILLSSIGGEHSDHLLEIVNMMEEQNFINSATYDAIIDYYIEGDNLDMGLHKLAEMNDRGMNPNLPTAQRVILKAAEQGYPRLAMDLATAYENSSLRRIDSETWVNLLAACADNFYADGVQACWTKLTKDLKVTIHEGLCLSVLNTAARHGLPSLAASVLHEFDALKVPLQEYHLAPVLEAFAVNGQIKEAFRILDLIRASGNVPSLATARPILQVIQSDPDTVDNAYTVLEELSTEGQKMDIVAANVIVEAAVSLNDIQRAIGIYKSLPTLGLTPNIDTYNLLMDVCRRVGHRELAERLFKDMADSNVKPDANTYRHFIRVQLMQTNYEEAFFYLEDMKGKGLKPTRPIYESIIRRCVSVGDSRYKLAVEEMEQMGYDIMSGLQQYIDSGGASGRDSR